MSRSSRSPNPARRVRALLTLAVAAPTLAVTGLATTGLAATAQADGDTLTRLASRTGLTESGVREVLADDATAELDAGELLFREPAAPAGVQERSDAEAAAATSGSDAGSQRLAPLAETFSLHSNPGADLVIFLDVDGGSDIGSAWDSDVQGTHPAWDPAGDGPAFSAAEKTLVQEVWSRVAEDYAPFDVDVTTQDPGQAALVRTDSSDTRYGTRVLITPSSVAYADLCPNGCGGLAYVGIFAATGGRYSPAWVFPQGTGNSAKSVAEAAAHEAGHNLGLTHDGDASSSYSGGQGSWAPIMGVGYYRPVTQWSQGSYAGATNTQDDVAILRGRLGSRADEAGATAATAAALTATGAGALGGTGVIGSADDVDAWTLGTCAAGGSVTVTAPDLGTDLDVRARLVRAGDVGSPLAVAAPTTTTVNSRTAAGMDAGLTVPADESDWVVLVDGVGQGSWSSGGYDDYGSLGQYVVTATGCAGSGATTGTSNETTDTSTGAPDAPGRPRVRVRGDGSVVLTWAAAQGDVSAYRVRGTQVRRTVAADVRRVVVRNLDGGQHRVRVVAVGDGGTAASPWRRWRMG
ncbi:fibronectin type III domain-containing protein [Nocardioides sp. GY 10127]|uniref:fibronectin type III domain-containing protein n=1 Tax=Nocardioides sp. GY 10127 TaxID=2569762 RepID=UPI0010A82A6A|nr:fibronectin type III domain-containing protein [Nocardioides sp. GY 10127]TIC79409.1 fibronectin type III domain-containing protein [Nocardioides sp. GY 10127]